mmetsp:Transcript_26881/g.37881  ORF Transcript_26881/g.37881 Transcript_26881/m.37881 type:complete len:584 (+) Transcript_26881:250-2001(+)
MSNIILHQVSDASNDVFIHDERIISNENDKHKNDVDKDDDNDYWVPTGIAWRDFLHFVGPGFLVSIAYVDPGNYQADIHAGSTSRYTLLFCIWWTSLLSIYVQILCVRLAYYGQVTLAEAQARDIRQQQKFSSTTGVNISYYLKYINWFIAEVSTILTDLPEVIGIGIALQIFWEWPYYVGVLLSLLTTMIFLGAMNICGFKVLERVVYLFVGIMSIALFLEMNFVGVQTDELLEGWIWGFTKVSKNDMFSMTGILGAVVMPHNLYLHTAACQSRSKLIKRTTRTTPTTTTKHPNNGMMHHETEEHDYQYDDIIQQAVRYSSLETILPIIFSFFVNMAVVAIAAERVGGPNATSTQEEREHVGLTDFCQYFEAIKGGCVLWGIALLAAGQSSAITTTFTGQYVMDGFLNIQLPIKVRAIVTRLVAITPCVIVSVVFPNRLNKMINIVNSCLSFLLPFAFTPLVKYNCSETYMGPKYVTKGIERTILYIFAISVWLINAFALSARGGGMFGDFVQDMEFSFGKVLYVLLEIIIQVFYFVWNAYYLFAPEGNIDTTTRHQHVPCIQMSSQQETSSPVEATNGQYA